jgi:hypothetical protein
MYIKRIIKNWKGTAEKQKAFTLDKDEIACCVRWRREY